MLLAVDATMAWLLFLVVGQFRFTDADWSNLWLALDVNARLAAALYAGTWVLLLWYLGLYAFRVRWTLAGEAGDVLAAGLMLTFASLSFLYLIKVDVSRLFLLILLVSQPVVTILGRLVLRALFNWFRAHGYNRCFMVVVGAGAEAQAFADSVERHPELGIEIVGHLRGPNERKSKVTRPILGDATDLERLFRERVVDEVALCAGPDSADWTQPLIRLAADEGKHVRVPTTMPARTFGLQTEELDGMLIRSYINGPSRLLSLAVKRLMDMAGSAIGLVLASPFLLLSAIAILLDDGRPILYHQTRLGLHGRAFTLHKLRTMDRDADARFGEVQHLNERRTVTFKSAHDPRVTRVGRFLRASSLDELPQLWNVLKGEMSLVGPRPPLEREINQYDVWHRRRLSMKPGITGLWQVQARHEPEFDRWVERDLAYIDRWSLLLDLRILLQTVPAVIGRTGK